MKAGPSKLKKRTRRILLGLAGAVLLYALLGFFTAPPLLKKILRERLAETLGREVTIESVEVNPFSLSVKVRDLVVDGRDSDPPLFSFTELFVNLKASSLIHGGPVLSELAVTAPNLRLVRLQDGTYNVQDLIDESGGEVEGGEGERLRFSLNNIQITEGAVVFEDRPADRTHTVEAISLGIPRLSNLSDHANLTVEPHFTAVVNGEPVSLTGRSKSQSWGVETEMEFTFRDIDLPHYLAYVGKELPLEIPSARISGTLALSFRTSSRTGDSAFISGTLDLENVEIQDADRVPLLQFPSGRIQLRSLDPFGRSLEMASVALDRPEGWIDRMEDGEMRFPDLPGSGPEESGFSFLVDSITATQGKVHFTDASQDSPFRVDGLDVNLSLRGLSDTPGAEAAYEVSLRTEAETTARYAGTLTLEPLLLDGVLAVEALDPGIFEPYWDPPVPLRVLEGRVNGSSRFIIDGTDEEETEVAFLDTNLTISGPEIGIDDASEKDIVAEIVLLQDGRLETESRRLHLGTLSVQKLDLDLRYEETGEWNLLALFPEIEKDPGSEGWEISLDRAVLEGGTLSLKDLSSGEAPILKGGLDRLVLEELSTEGEAAGRIDLDLSLDLGGRLLAEGDLGLEPFRVDLVLDLEGLNLAPLAYLAPETLPGSLEAGLLSADGHLTLTDEEAEGFGGGFEGDVDLARFGVKERDGRPLMVADSLSLSDVTLRSSPFAVAIREVSLEKPLMHLTIDEQGKFFLDRFPEEESGSAPADPVSIKVGALSVRDGTLLFEDRHVSPVYKAELSGIEGRMTAFSREPPVRGDLELTAMVDRTALLSLGGTLNPVEDPPYYDLRLQIAGLDLAPMTAYSERYLGYELDAGKLTLDGTYLLENRVFRGEKRLMLDRLEFGAKVESPEATDLPVLMAISLLRDRNDEIHVNLPFEGSTDDPDFKVRSLMLRLIKNLIKRVVTAPFALFGGFFKERGRGGYLLFEPGEAVIPPEEETALFEFARILNDRPLLEIDLVGHADPALDKAAGGLEELALQRARAVRDALLASGKVEPGRLFIAPPVISPKPTKPLDGTPASPYVELRPR